MAKRYAIWDRRTDIWTPAKDKSIQGFTYSTPVGTQHFTPEEWLMLHDAPPNAVIICATGDYNGGYFGTLGQLMQIYEDMGADFSNANTNEEKLNVFT